MKIRIHPCRELRGRVEAPPSKNYTTRYLLAAALAEGESLVINPSRNDDSLVMQKCLRELGAEIEPRGRDLLIRGFGRKPRPRAELNVGNAGAVARFLMAVAALGEEISFATPYPDSLGRRPHGDLFAALRALGAEIESNDDRLPAVIRGRGLRGGEVGLSGKVSSQFLSALLFLAPLLPEGLAVRIVDELRSQPLIHTTLEVLAAAGIEAEADWDRLYFRVPGGQSYRPGQYIVNGDYPAAVAVLAAAAILPGEVEVAGLRPDSQGERLAVDALAAMGARIEREPDRIRLIGGAPLRGIVFNGDRATDAVLSLATAAAFAAGETTIAGVGNLRYKESDRLGDFARVMRAAGLDVTPDGECLRLRGRPEGVAGGVTVPAHNDHRLVMALTAVGLRSERGIVIDGAEHVSKSYPGFFADLARLGAVTTNA